MIKFIFDAEIEFVADGLSRSPLAMMTWRRKELVAPAKLGKLLLGSGCVTGTRSR